jgi:hypothetical protein
LAFFPAVEDYLSSAHGRERLYDVVRAAGSEKPKVAKRSAPAIAQVDHPYIRRTELEAQFQELVTKGIKFIVLRGQPGMGKTKLAEEVTRDPNTGVLAPLIRFDSKLSIHLQEALSSLGMNAREAINQDPWTLIAMMTCHVEKAPQFLVLDDLEDADEIIEKLPRAPRSTIVLTCRSSRRTSLDQIVDVTEMEPHEAEALIGSRLVARNSGVFTWRCCRPAS